MPIIRRKDERKGFTILGKFGGGQPTPPPIDYSKIPMFFENVDNKDITIGIRKSDSSSFTAKLEISNDGNTWESWGNTSTTALTKQIPVGGKLYIKAPSSYFYFNNNVTVYKYFTSSGKVSVGGNIESLAFVGYNTMHPIIAKYAYNHTFYNMTNLVDASKLVLPATTSTDYCYYYMFSGCTALTTAPALPATTLKSSCYSYMFRDCTSLTKAPALPATTLASNCYQFMFQGCTALTTAPELPATTLASNCYNSMFAYCESLTEIPELPATTLTDNCYNQMFYYCTSLTTAPELPATTLASGCYYLMFGNTKVNKIITYAKDISASSCLYYWLYNISPTGDFYNLGGATYPSGSSGIPEGWTEHTTLE